ncbi:MAG: HIT domain-containing protein [Candidatus Cloacimonetes bacterium]|nr:HIT domain-containing protein [Candidatus Cloacimonadota bacterium]
MTKNLYSPWRYEYLISEKPDGCIFCFNKEEDEKRLVLHRSKHSFVIMNLYPYNNGHIMVVAQRHVSNLTDLQPEELHDMFSTVQLCERVLQKRYNADGLNVGINIGKAAGAGVDDHLHIHIVPRWFGDANFMSIVAEIRVIPEDFEQAYQMLKECFIECVNEE